MRSEDRELPPGEAEGSSPGEGRAKLPHILPGEERERRFFLFFLHGSQRTISSKGAKINLFFFFEENQRRNTPIAAGTDRQVSMEDLGVCGRCPYERPQQC